MAVNKSLKELIDKKQQNASKMVRALEVSRVGEDLAFQEYSYYLGRQSAFFELVMYIRIIEGFGKTCFKG